ncbi:MAG: DNA repair exonuclease [Candidatus Binatia bacterium]
MKFVHAADVHLDSPLHGLERYAGAPVEEFRGATRRALENLIRLCVDEEADALLLAGDLYDGDWRDFGTGLFFSAQMARLREAGVRVFVVRGNHDAQSRITKSLRLPENVHMFRSRRPETVVVDKLGLAVHGQSFSQADVTENLAGGYPAPRSGLLNVGLLHTSADGRPGHANYAPCRLQDLVAKGYDYWALGHVHAREVVHQDPWVVFPGNLQGRHARETGAKGCTLVTVDDGRITVVEPKWLDVVRWTVVDLDASNCATPNDVLDRLSAALRSAVDDAGGRVCAARVRVGGRTAAHASLLNRKDSWVNDARALATDVGAGEVWIEKVTLATVPEIDWRERAAQSGPVGELLRDIESLGGDGARLRQLIERFADLNAKLPAELREREGEDGFRIDETRLRESLAGMASVILPRLLDAEDGE